MYRSLIAAPAPAGPQLHGDLRVRGQHGVGRQQNLARAYSNGVQALQPRDAQLQK